MQVSVRELKNHLSKYLHSLKEGKMLIITSHQTPLAKLTLIPQIKNKNLQELYQIEGLHWNGKKPQGNKKGPAVSGNTASSYIIEDRR